MFMEQSGRSSGHGVEIDTDVLNQIQRRFVERLGLNNIPTPAYRQQLRRVPDFLKQLLAARSRVMTSSCPDQSPLSAVALSPLRSQLMFSTLLLRSIIVTVILSVIRYELRTRPHCMTLINKTKFLNDTDFIIRLLYKHSY